MSIQTETGITIPNPPAGYVYVGVGPLLALLPRGMQKRGHIALLQSWNDTRPWDTECQFNGQSEGMHYAVLLGTEAHDLLFPAAPAPAAPAAPLTPPEGYVYVGQGPLTALGTREQPAGDLALLHGSSLLNPRWEWAPTYGYNGQSHNVHYAARIGSNAQRLLRPAEGNPQLELMNTKPEEPEENEEDEVPEGITLPDGTLVDEADCIDVVVEGWCEQYSSYNSTYYARSSNFRTAPMPEDYEGVRWLERENLHALESECDIVETSNGDHSFRENCRRIDGDWYHIDDISYDGHGNPYPSDSGDYVYCQGEGETYSRDECHWCEAADTYVYGDEEDCECNRSESEDHINEYHGSPKPTFYRNYPCSGWGIGFEVEKNDINGASGEGEYVGSSDLFSGWECDASCGVEGITHVYDPHTCADKFKQHVANSKRWLDAACDRSCGGHINISSDKHTPRELLQAMRKYAPLWYALYRNRLNNTYCVEDKKVEHGTTKYSPLRTKSFGVELRLPPAVHNGEQLVRRFELMSLCCTAIDEGWSLQQYVRSCKPLLFEQVFNKNRVRYCNVLRLTRKFDRWFKDGHIHADIAQYV